MDETAKLKKVKKLEAQSWKDSKTMESLQREIVDILEKVLEQNPKNAVALTNLGAMYSNSARYEEALVLLENAQKLGFEDQNLYFNIGVVYVGLEQDRKAIKYFKMSQSLKPNKLTFKAYIDFHAL